MGLIGLVWYFFAIAEIPMSTTDQKSGDLEQYWDQWYVYIY